MSQVSLIKKKNYPKKLAYQESLGYYYVIFSFIRQVELLVVRSCTC